MRNNNKAKSDFLGYLLLIVGCGILLMSGSGCAGLEVGGRLGLYRVDARKESQETYMNHKPAICYLFPSRCDAQGTTEVQGS